MNRIVAAIGLGSAAYLGLAFVGHALATEPPAGKATVERLKADVYYLASDTLEGRGIATPGLALAAQHVRAEFARIGLKGGAAGGGYDQPFPASGTTASNVVGVVEGSGDLAHETIIVGAHYDHLGYGPRGNQASGARRGRIHRGADDNASGTSAMLELARRFASGRGPTPRRRLVFIAFGEEEAGLVGSRYYASTAPLFPIKDTVAMLNFDMVGRLRGGELGVAGNKTAREFDDLLALANTKPYVTLRLGGDELPDDSDHAPFLKAGVPVLYLCTGGHDDRHTPADTADKINFEGIATVVDFSEAVLDRLLVMPRPTYLPPAKVQKTD